MGCTGSVVPPSRKDDLYGFEVLIPCHCLTWEMLASFEKVDIAPSLTWDFNILWSLLVAKERRGAFINKKCLLMCQDVAGAFIYILV